MSNFRETDTISFAADACAATKSTSTKFDLGSMDNRKPISFFTYHHITTELQPSLEKQKKQLEAQKATGSSGLDDEIKAVEAAIAGWKEILLDYEKTNQQACKQSFPSGRPLAGGKYETCGDGLGVELKSGKDWVSNVAYFQSSPFI